jgi:hypothetical protein
MPEIREILVIPHIHHDIGYTHVPDVCMQMHERSIYEVIKLCEQGDDAFVIDLGPHELAIVQAVFNTGKIMCSRLA